MPSYPHSAWARLGELLVRRRIELDSRYRNRRTFTSERAVEYRIVNDIELGRRDNYEPATLAGLEVAYELAPGAISRTLAGDGLEPQAGVTVQLPAAVVRPRDRRLPVLDVDDEEALRPFVLSVRRDLLAAAGFRFGPGREVPDLPEVEEYLASLPGALIFAADHEARVWDYEPMSAQERLRLIAVLRQMGAAARDAAEEPGERNAVLARAT